MEFSNVSFTYAGAPSCSITDMSLTVEPGTCVVLTGPSGCGKTTAIRVANGLACDFYEGTLSGSVRLAGRDINALPSWERARQIGSVFQNPRTQFFNLDTTGEVVFGMENLGVEREEMRRRYERVVRDLGIAPLMDRDIFGLSGGERQAIAFASAWANTPSVYVLDEPSSSLDPRAMSRLAGLIAKAKEGGAAILIAEHRLFWLADVADRFVCMSEGTIVGTWSSREFRALDDAKRQRLGMRGLDLPDLQQLEDRAQRPHATACEVKDLRASYGTRLVLDRIGLALSHGEVVGIVGENGRGKSTLFRCICGLHREDFGEVLFDERRVPVRRRSSEAFLVMQDTDYQLFRVSVRAELEFSARRGKRQPGEVASLLELLGLTDVVERHPASLSGGQKQRVVCAKAALSTAGVILLDEPTSGLDFTNMDRLATLVREFSRQGKAVAVISHDAEFLSRACGRVVRI